MKRSIPLAALLAAATVAQAATLPKPIVDRVAAACVLIQAVKGDKADAGSGFFVGRGEVLTNYHVVKAAIEGDAKVVLVIGTDPARRRVVDAEVLAGDEEADLALLRTSEKNVNTLRFGSDRSLQLTQSAWVAGFPFGTKAGLEVTLTAGTVSALRHDEAGQLYQVQLDAAVNPGNSGGPVVDERGNVIGVSRAVVKPTVGSGMAMAIPAGVADKFVKGAPRGRRRTARLHIAGKLPGRGLRIVSAEKAEEIQGIGVSVTIRGSGKSSEAVPFELEFSNRRREVIGREKVDPSGLEAREEKTFTLRLRGVQFDDVATCRIVE